MTRGIVGILAEKVERLVSAILTAGAIVKAGARAIALRFRPVRLSDGAFLRAVGHDSVGDVLKAALPLFFFDSEERDSITEGLKRQYAEKVSEVISAADRLCEHVFDLLGSGPVALGQDIDWHRDFRSGFQWSPRTVYLGTRRHVDCYLRKGIPADVKVPWELSRCQHFPTLGKAYWLTDDEKYAKEFVEEVRHWIRQNPVGLGVNWTCTMDVAIRAVNWVWGYYFFRHSPSLDGRFRCELLKSLFLHGRHIINHLEFGPRRGNHYLADIVGLVYLGSFFQQSREGGTWLDRGVQAIMQEMVYQVHPDGVDFEGSIPYHRYVTEFFLTATILCLKNGRHFPEWYMQRLEKMVEFVMYYTRPDGTAPQIGDNDDGRLQVLADYGNWDPADHRYLLAIGAALFDRPEFKAAAGQHHEEAFWLLEENRMHETGSLAVQEPGRHSKGWPEGGYYVLRKDGLHMTVDCLPPPDEAAPSGHRHNSRLSFELFAYDKTFVVDPGTYVYTADAAMRNLFRSTPYHNTVVVDGEEQSTFDRDSLFAIGSEGRARVSRWESNEGYDLLDAEHSGYERLLLPVHHRRIIFFDKQEAVWIVRDILSGSGVHRLDAHFHLAPTEAELDPEGHFVVITRGYGANLAIMPLEAENLGAEIDTGWVSLRYGVKTEAPVVKYTTERGVPTSLRFALCACPGAVDIDDAWARARRADRRFQDL